MSRSHLEKPLSHYNINPTIHFDKATIKLLRKINRSGDKGITWGELQKKFGTNANIFILEALTVELYTVTQNKEGEWLAFDSMDGNRDHSFRSFSTPKGNELLEQRSFNFWKWVIPTFISVVALVISALSAILR